jgi:hypothetical protein
MIILNSDTQQDTHDKDCKISHNKGHINKAHFALIKVLTAVVMKSTVFDPDDGGDVPPKHLLTFDGLRGVIT